MKDPDLSSGRYRFIRGRTLNWRRGTLDRVGGGMAPPGLTTASLKRSQIVEFDNRIERCRLRMDSKEAGSPQGLYKTST